MSNQVLIALFSIPTALFFFLAAALPKIRPRNTDVSNYARISIGPIGFWKRIGPYRTMNFSGRTFFLGGCFFTIISLLQLLDHYFPFGDARPLVYLCLSALVMIAIILSAAYDSVSGNNPKTLKADTHIDEEVV